MDRAYIDRVRRAWMDRAGWVWMDNGQVGRKSELEGQQKALKVKYFKLKKLQKAGKH